MSVDGGAFLDGGFSATGTVRLPGAQISGQLACTGATLDGDGDGGPALDGDRLSVDGDAFLDGGFSATGTVRLPGAQISGQLACTGATLDGDGGPALDGDGLSVDGGAFLDGGFSATGTVRLPGAQISGQLNCTGATLDGNGDRALVGDGLSVDGGAFLDGGFSATGTVRLPGAQISGPLNCTGATLDGDGGPALDGDGLSVHGDAVLTGGFSATGTVRLLGAQISGQLACRDATLDGNGDSALDGDRMSVDGGAFLDGGFSATGTVRLPGAQISGQLNCTGATLDGNGDRALGGQGMSVSLAVLLHDTTVVGELDLMEATAGQLVVAGGDWSRATVHALGMAYRSIVPGPGEVSVKERIDWLGLKDGHYEPGPFDVLAAAYERNGLDRAERDVRVAKQRARRTVLPWYKRLLDRVWDTTVQYGFATWRAVAALVIVIAVAGLLVADCDCQTRLLEDGPSFYPGWFAADTVIPVIDLRQTRFWTLEGWHEHAARLATGLGWFLTTATAVGLSGVLTRRD